MWQTPQYRHALVCHPLFQSLSADVVLVTRKTERITALCAVQNAEVSFEKLKFSFPKKTKTQVLQDWLRPYPHSTLSELNQLQNYRTATQPAHTVLKSLTCVIPPHHQRAILMMCLLTQATLVLRYKNSLII